MEELFRFVVLRPAEPRAVAGLVLTPSASFRAALEAAFGSSRPGAALAAAAKARRAQIQSSLFEEPLFERLAHWLSANAGESRANALATSAAMLGADIHVIAKDATAMRARAELSDLAIAHKYAGRTWPEVAALEPAVRASLLLDDLIEDPDGISSPADFAQRTISIVVTPPEIAAAPISSRPREPSPDLTLREEIVAHRDALRDLAALGPDAFAPEREARPATGEARGLVVSPAAARALPALTRKLLEDRGIDLATLPLKQMGARLRSSLLDLHARQLALTSKTRPTRVVKLNGGIYEIAPALIGALDLADLDPVPTTHGNHDAVGVADLLVVRQQLTGYAASELSHVENVLRGEHKSRENTRSQTIEQTDSSETETTREEERDQESTERNELQRETEASLHDQLSLDVDSTVSGSYGPAAQFSINTQLGTEQTKEQSNKFAQTVSKEATQRAVTKVTSRAKQTSTRKVTDTFTETNIHEIDNRAAQGPVIGMYQWLDKLYEAQVFNYGIRAMYDVVVPEPAALLLHLAAEAPTPEAGIEKPVPFGLTAFEIDEGNYAHYVQLYDATGVEAPPDLTRSFSKVLDAAADDASGGIIHLSADLPIPDGYAALQGTATVAIASEKEVDPAPRVDVLIGTAKLVLALGSTSQSSLLASQVVSISVAMLASQAKAVAATVTVECVRTDRALEDWKLKTHAAIKQGYMKQLQDFETKVARAKAQAIAVTDVAPVRATPQTIRAELKRLAIELFTRQHFNMFGAVSESATKLPELRFDQVGPEGAYIRFFEQAFEWEQMSYVFYPYFWGRRAQWRTRVLIEDVDPEYARFLKAGAARLVVPVRPSSTHAVAHFFETGQVWAGGDVPPISSDMYLSIVDEIREQTGAPGNETPIDAPWPVRLPTQLIKLRTADGLPSWTKDDAGKWHPVD